MSTAQDQHRFAEALAEELEMNGIEDIDALMILDSLAMAGLALVRLRIDLEAAEAYMKRVTRHGG